MVMEVHQSSGASPKASVPINKKAEVAPLAAEASPIGGPNRKKKDPPSEMDMEVHQSSDASPNVSIPMTMAKPDGTGSAPSPLMDSDSPEKAGHHQNCSTTEIEFIDMESNESDIKAAAVVPDGFKDEEAAPTTWNRRKCMILSLIVLVIVGAAVGIVIWLTSDSDEDVVTSNRLIDITTVKPGTVTAQVPENLCNEWVPGQGKSKLCSILASSSRGGQVANLVATSFLKGSMMGAADMSIINAGLVKGDIGFPEVTVEDMMAIVGDDRLVVVDIPGASIRWLLEIAIEMSVGENPLPSAYPYGGNLRFSVDATKKFGFRVSEVQVLSKVFSDRFVNIADNGYYTVITTSYLAGGGDGYKEFDAIVDAWKTELPQNTINTFYTYVSNMEELIFDVEYSTVSFVAPIYDPGLATVPTNVCLEWTPGAGKSEICTPEETIVQGGGLCNLVAWAFLDQNFRADIALVRAGDYSSDIVQGTFKASDLEAIFPVDHRLVTIKVNGKQLEDILEAVLVGALDSADPRPEAYPYAAGLRFNVDAAAAFGSRTSNVEFFKNTRWVPLETEKIYTVVTTENLANGDDPAYLGFSLADRITGGKLSAAETFLAFATEWAVLFDPPREKYSTQVYLSA
jgi:hypothetical protein